MAPLPSKKDVLLGLLEKTSVLVHLDARQQTVQVPKHLKANPQLILQLGLDLAVPIRDLEVDDVGVRCTLSFSRSPFYCVIPYEAVFAIVSEDGGKAMVWPDDVPPEVARAAEAEARKLGLLEPRPGERNLVAVPQPAASSPMLGGDGVDGEARIESPAMQVVAPKPASKRPASVRPSDGPPRSKRELPPYLRVIK